MKCPLTTAIRIKEGCQPGNIMFDKYVFLIGSGVLYLIQEMQMVNYDLLTQQIHGLFLQACALAHITPLNDEDWRRSIGVSFQPLKSTWLASRWTMAR